MTTETSKIRNTMGPTPMYESMSTEDKMTVEDLYRLRLAGEGFPEEFTDFESRIEFLAHEYHNQLRAFEDVLTEQGFEPVRDVPRTYGGRIAALTRNGTVTMLGKVQKVPKKGNTFGRVTTSSRIWKPDLTLKGEFTHVVSDPTLGQSLRLMVYDNPLVPGYNSSALRGLAVNPRGVNGDELVDMTATLAEMTKTCTGMGQETMDYLLQPRKKQEQR